MSITTRSPHKSLHQQAFGHYLRTGERLTNAEWFARHERKFNPYHDEIGRFTSPPGVTVSWGRQSANQGGVSRSPSRSTSGDSSARPKANSSAEPGPLSAIAKPGASSGDTNSQDAATGFHSDLVRNRVNSQTSRADTYFELNRRQAYLNQLRTEAGANASEVVRADLDDFQRRLNTDRERLNEITRRLIDPETLEIGRAGLAPLDTAVSTIKVFLGEGGAGDYLTVASSVPIAGTVGRLAKFALAARVAERGAGRVVSEIIQLGGAYRDIKGLPGHHGHHTPGKAVSSLSEGEGPAVAMLKEDHLALPSSKRGRRGDRFRKAQAELIAQGDFRAAIQMDIDQIRSQFGTKYDEGIEQMLKYAKNKGYIK